MAAFLTGRRPRRLANGGQSRRLARDAVWKPGYFRPTIELIKTGPAATPGELEYRSERFLMAEHTPLAALDLTGRISTAGCSVNDATPALIKLPAAML